MRTFIVGRMSPDEPQAVGALLSELGHRARVAGASSILFCEPLPLLVTAVLVGQACALDGAVYHGGRAVYFIPTYR